ncbi:GNAT family N-acetyltransferase [Bacillus sp. 1P06AnD]|uniref:GNAT family N-acetyltransferase n=1 Tax=Bacillus sp. 1P06AnD TaxID=3132208 RepID=UPI0039A3DEBF
MSELTFKKLENELGDLVTFMTDHFWEFHSNPQQTKEQIIKGFNNGWYQEDKETFWIEHANKKIGLIIIHDISDTIPLFDIRLDNSVRGKGFGTKAVCWITDYIFGLPDKKIRIEAYTRSDNIAMRKTLSKCGFIKEGYLRCAWENDDGSVSDSICYAIIRRDWEGNISTPIKLNDLPF